MQEPPVDFVAYELCLKEARRYVRVGKDVWSVMRWHGGWVHTHNVSDAVAVTALRMADYAFVPPHQAESAKQIEELEAKVTRLEGEGIEIRIGSRKRFMMSRREAAALVGVIVDVLADDNLVSVEIA